MNEDVRRRLLRGRPLPKDVTEVRERRLTVVAFLSCVYLSLEWTGWNGHYFPTLGWRTAWYCVWNVLSSMACQGYVANGLSCNTTTC